MNTLARDLQAECRPTRVVFTVDSLSQAGGLERVLTTRCNHLVKDAAFQLTIVTLDPVGATPFFWLDPRVTVRALDVKINRSSGLYSLSNLGQAARYAKRLHAILGDIDPHVVVNCDHNYSTYVLPLLQRRARMFHEHHTTSAQQRRAGVAANLKDRIRRLSVGRFDQRIFLSSSEARLSGFDDAIVIPNPVSPRETPRLKKRLPVVLAAGRILPVKGFDRLIDAWAIVAPSHPEWVLKIFGHGTLDAVEALKSRARNLAISEQVQIHPPTCDLSDEMRKASIYALSSRSETFPMVLLESMRDGLPVVSFDCPTGPAQILENGRTGVLVSNDDVGAFACELATMIADPFRRRVMAAAAREEVNRYSLDTIGDKWKALLRERRRASR